MLKELICLLGWYMAVPSLLLSLPTGYQGGATLIAAQCVSRGVAGGYPLRHIACRRGLSPRHKPKERRPLLIHRTPIAVVRQGRAAISAAPPKASNKGTPHLQRDQAMLRQHGIVQQIAFLAFLQGFQGTEGTKLKSPVILVLGRRHGWTNTYVIRLNALLSMMHVPSVSD